MSGVLCQALYAPGRVFTRHDPNPGRKVATRSKNRRIRDGCRTAIERISATWSAAEVSWTMKRHRSNEERALAVRIDSPAAGTEPMPWTRKRRLVAWAAGSLATRFLTLAYAHPWPESVRLGGGGKASGARPQARPVSGRGRRPRSWPNPACPPPRPYGPSYPAHSTRATIPAWVSTGARWEASARAGSERGRSPARVAQPNNLRSSRRCRIAQPLHNQDEDKEGEKQPGHNSEKHAGERSPLAPCTDRKNRKHRYETECRQ
jgi:hypothetical protein